MEILGKIGIDFKLLIAQIINFLLLLWILKRFVFKSLIQKIEQDEKKLEKAQEINKVVLREKNKFIKEKKINIIESKKRAREIIKEAEEIAENIKNKAYKEAKVEKQAVIKQIRGRLEKK